MMEKAEVMKRLTNTELRALLEVFGELNPELITDDVIEAMQAAQEELKLRKTAFEQVQAERK